MIRLAVESVTMASPAIVLAPLAILLAGAALSASLPEAGLDSPYLVRGLPAGLILIAALLTLTGSYTYVPVSSFPLGNVSAPLIDLRTDSLALHWVSLVLLVSLGVSLTAPVEVLPRVLVATGLGCVSFFAGGMAALCLAWFVTEAALLLLEGDSSTRPVMPLPFVLSVAAMLGAVYSSPSDEALVLSQSSLTPRSWSLAILAVTFRLRIWPFPGRQIAGPLAALRLAIAAATGFYVLTEFGGAAAPGYPSDALVLAVFLGVTFAALYGWSRATPSQGLIWWCSLALSGTLILQAALSIPPLATLGPAAAHLVAVLAAHSLAVRLRPSRPLPAWLAPALAVAAVLSLLPWPLLPFGQALQHLFSLLMGTRPLLALLLAFWLCLPSAGLVLAALEGAIEPESATRRPLVSVAVLLAAAGGLVLGLGFSSRFAEPPSVASPPATVGAGILALALTVLVLGAVAAAWLGVMPRSLGKDETGTGEPWLTWPLRLLATAARYLDIVFRFVEGETPLAWSALVGVAILIAASGT